MPAKLIDHVVCGLPADPRYWAEAWDLTVRAPTSAEAQALRDLSAQDGGAPTDADDERGKFERLEAMLRPLIDTGAAENKVELERIKAHSLSGYQSLIWSIGLALLGRERVEMLEIKLKN